MEAIKTRLKSIAWFLTALMLFQSCVVYHKTPTTLEKASQEQIKTKITNANGETLKYKYIAYEEGVYYGYVEQDWAEFIKVPLNKEDILSVKTKNKTASTLITISVIAIPVLAFAVWQSLENMSLGGGGWGSWPLLNPCCVDLKTGSSCCSI